MRRLIDFKDLLEKHWNPDSSWMENGSLWAKKETENGDVLVEIKTAIWNCHMSVFWKSPFADERVGMISIFHRQVKYLKDEEVLEWLDNSEKEIEERIGKTVRSMEK